MILKIKLLINTYFTVSIILFSGAILTLGGEILGTASLEGDPVQRGVYFIIYLIMIPIILVNINKIYYMLIKEKLISVILILSILSFLWSDLPIITFRRVVALTLTTLFGVLFARYYNLEAQIKILAYAFGIIIVLCFITPIILPEIGIHQFGTHEGLWRGVFVQKNSMASMVVISIIVFIYKIKTIDNNKYVYVIFLFISLLLILFSWSTTAIVSLFIIFICLYLFISYTKLSKNNLVINIIILLSVLLSFALLVFNNLDVIFDTFGKDVTLTGRLPLWYFLFEFIENKPLLGYGFGAFWHGSESPSASVIQQFPWIPKDAHNGYIDIILNIGIIGLLLIVIKIFDIFINSKKLYKIKYDKKYLLTISILVYILLINITSTSILVQNSIFWILFVSMSIGINNEHNGRMKYN